MNSESSEIMVTVRITEGALSGSTHQSVTRTLWGECLCPVTTVWKLQLIWSQRPGNDGLGSRLWAQLLFCSAAQGHGVHSLVHSQTFYPFPYCKYSGIFTIQTHVAWYRHMCTHRICKHMETQAMGNQSRVNPVWKHLTGFLEEVMLQLSLERDQLWRWEKEFHGERPGGERMLDSLKDREELGKQGNA